MPTLMAAHDQRPKSHVAPCFNHFDLTNAIIPIMMLSAPHDANSSASGGVTCPKKVMLHCFLIVLI